MDTMIERMIVSGAERRYFHVGTPEFDSASEMVTRQFPLAQPETWGAVSTPIYNPIYEEQIVSAIFATRPGYTTLMDYEPMCVSRKFFMTTGRIYDKHYRWVNASTCDLDYPENAHPLAVACLEAVWGHPGVEDLSAIRDVYFICTDHKAVENWAGESLPQGTELTHYGATSFDGERRRVKAYCYDDANSPFAAWEAQWLAYANRHGLNH